MIKKRAAAYRLMFSLLSITLGWISCAPQRDPNMQLTGFLEALKAKDYQTAYDLCSFKDRYTKSESEFIADFTSADKEAQSVGIADFQISYTIDTVITQKDTALAYVELKMLDLTNSRYRLVLDTVIDESIVDSIITEPDNITYILSISGILRLAKDFKGYFVYAHWEERRRQEAEESRIRLDYINEFLKVKSKKLDIYPYADKAYLTATLVNAGQKTLKGVELMITCLDKENKPCDILTYHPVNRSRGFLGPKKTMRFRIDLSKSSGEWAKKVEIKIVNCQFL